MQKMVYIDENGGVLETSPEADKVYVEVYDNLIAQGVSSADANAQAVKAAEQMDAVCLNGIIGE